MTPSLYCLKLSCRHLFLVSSLDFSGSDAKVHPSPMSKALSMFRPTALPNNLVYLFARSWVEVDGEMLLEWSAPTLFAGGYPR